MPIINVGASALTLLTAQPIITPVAAIDFTSRIDATYARYMLEITGLTPADSGYGVEVQASINGGASWVALTYQGVAIISANGGAVTPSAPNTFRMDGNNGVSNTAARGGFNATIWLDNLASTTQEKFGRFSAAFHTGAAYATVNGMCGILTTSAVNALRVKCSGGLSNSGQVNLYGEQK